MRASTRARRAGRHAGQPRRGRRRLGPPPRSGSRTVAGEVGRVRAGASADGQSTVRPRSRSAASRSASGRSAQSAGRSSLVAPSASAQRGAEPAERPRGPRLDGARGEVRAPRAVSASDRSSRNRAPITSRSSSRSRPSAASSVRRDARRRAPRPPGDGDRRAAPAVADVRPGRARSARRSAERRRLRLSLATIRSSHGRTGAPVPKARQRGVGLDEGVLDGIGGIGLRGDEMTQCAGRRPGSGARGSRTPRRRRCGRGRSVLSSSSVGGLRGQPYPVHRDGRSVPAGRRLPSDREHRTRLPPLDGRRSAGRGRGAWLDHPSIRPGASTSTPRAAPSWSTSATAGSRSPRPWPTRPLASRTRTAAPSPPSRSRPTRREVGATCPVDDPAIYPVSGGSEAIETALKMARAYHLAVGEPGRDVVIARWGSYHGNTLGALDLSGRPPLRRPYEPWLGRFRHVSAAYPYGAGRPGATALADAPRPSPPSWSGRSRRPGRARVAAFVGRADRRRDAGRRGPAGRLLAADRRGLPPPRRAADRRRGHDRLRADRALVRVRPLGPPTGPARGGQGGDVGLLAVRVRRRVRTRSMPRSPARRAASSTGSPTRTARSARPWPARCCGSLEDEDLVEASATKGDRLRDAAVGRAGRASGASARSAAAG